MIFMRRDISDRHFPIILTQQLPSIATTRPETKKQGEQKGIGICKELGVFIGYYASTQSCPRTPEERSVVTWRTASSSPERSRHRRTRSLPKFSLRWLAA